MRIILTLLVALSVLGDCTSSDRISPLPSALQTRQKQQVVVAQTTPIILSFNSNKGQAIVNRRSGAIELTLELKHLDPKQKYEIALATEPKGGALFDINNTQIFIGQAQSETIFIPDSHGALHIQSVHPERLMSHSDSATIVVHKANQEWTIVARSVKFQLQ